MSTYNIAVPALRTGDPEIFFDGATGKETGAQPFAVTIGNRAEAGALDFRKQIYRMRRAVTSVAGDRIGIDNTHVNETRPQGWMDGATYRVYRHDSTNKTFTKIRSGTVAAYHARQVSNYVCMNDDEKTTDTFYHTTWTGNYKPNATAYWVVATLN
ncbi:hypothetical protein, partial [Profundibacterium mesophilum]|uniref:hypothetical protein n=1 Tax=Profundibacterium mesophilum TaxID=1258573 RepID=UPI001F341A21